MEEQDVEETQQDHDWAASSRQQARRRRLESAATGMADEASSLPLTRASVEAALRMIAGDVHRTPVVTSQALSAMASQTRSGASPRIRLWLKCENMQRGGAFKARGAFHALRRLLEDEAWVAGGGRERGVVTHSSGNHAQALALAASSFGIPAHIIMPRNSLPVKIAATRSYGAAISFSGPTSHERSDTAAAVMHRTGAHLVPPYDHVDIILGQGTVGLELQDQVRDLSWPNNPYSLASHGQVSPALPHQQLPKDNPTTLDALIAPCGGGGLLSGLALSLSSTPTRLFGAEPSLNGADDARRGLHSGHRIPAVPATPTIADGLRTPLGIHPWSIIAGPPRLVDDIYAVSEDQILAAMRLLYERCKLVVEPSAAVGLAAVLFDPEFRSLAERQGGQGGWDVGVVLSGGNVHLDSLGDLLSQAPRL
ncbi:hypothetical protein CDD82_4849 [Ophiocordyceps australis]|uniref:Tryptophan synthase beta chain-like PALP domain-containing protein n=1 Tax=Ophiocordyceps australis TaxID=1399860 RepID=A0A2C5ZLB0_9HYPO|nr:hypothetical protein CDD82_4849 [Ophiocordyceps australis]